MRSLVMRSSKHTGIVSRASLRRRSWEVLSSLASGLAFSTTFAARLYYPSTFNGRNTPLASSHAPLPLVGFAVGWTCDAAMYADIFSHLASHGFVTVVPLFNDLSSQPLVQFNFRSQLSQLLSSLAFVGAQVRAGAGPAFGDATAGSWAGRIDASRFALAGHSAGAGVALQGAAEAGRRVAAVATLGAWVNIATTPWLSSLPSAITAPALMLSGEWDEHAPLADNGQRVYDLLTSPKLLPVIAGGSHCFLDWTAASDGAPLLGLLPWYGYSSCPKAQIAAMPPPVGRGGTGMRDQILLAQTHLAAFFGLYMLNDTDAAPLVWGDAMRDNSWWSSVQLAPGASLSAQPAEVEAAAGGVTLQAALSNLGVSAGNWSLTATAFMRAEPNASVATAEDAPANASVAGMLREQLSPAAPAPASSGLRLKLSDAWMALHADLDAAALQRSAALLPRAPALAAILAAFRRPPPPPAAPARRLLLQLPPSAPPSSAGGFSLEIDASQAAPGNHTVLLAARSLVDGGSTCYASIAVSVPAGVGLDPGADVAASQQGVAPLVSALAGAASAQMGRLAAALSAPAPPTVSALAGPDAPRLIDPKALGAAAAAAASQALAALASAAATLPPQQTSRDALQALAMQLLQALPSGLDFSALGGAAGAALASLRSALLIRVGFGALVTPPPRPPPPPPPATPSPPPPTALSAAADLLRGLDRLLHP